MSYLYAHGLAQRVSSISKNSGLLRHQAPASLGLKALSDCRKAVLVPGRLRYQAISSARSNPQPLWGGVGRKFSFLTPWWDNIEYILYISSDVSSRWRLYCFT
jgi:hypothetical protein